MQLTIIATLSIGFANNTNIITYRCSIEKTIIHFKQINSKCLD